MRKQFYTENDSKIVFWLRWLCSTFFVFARALCMQNGRSLQTKNLRSPAGRFALLTCSSLQMFTGHLQSIRSLAKFPTFESFSVYRKAALIAFVLSIVWKISFLHCVPISENWEEYRTDVMKEQPVFPGWCTKEKTLSIMNLLLANPSDICVEVGVYGGSSFFPAAAALAFKKQGVAYAIDPWSNEACIENYQPGEKIYQDWSKTNLEKVMHKFMKLMSRNQLDPFYLVMRMSSAQAVYYFEDESIDFIHIDGNHSEESAVFDVKNWLPKVKKGGIICFDDAQWKSTQSAVKILLNTCQLMPESPPKKQYLFLRKS